MVFEADAGEVGYSACVGGFRFFDFLFDEIFGDVGVDEDVGGF